MPAPVDPLIGPRFALRGRVVAMDPQRTVFDDGVVFVEDGLITSVQPATAPAPASCADLMPVDTGATLFPGLIELHNHLPYDVLPLWEVPKKYGNRAQWGGSSNPNYHRLVTGPMTVLGNDPAMMPAVVRYVEAKALVNGTTTSQGIALFSDAGARRLYRGVVRNVEATDDPALPEAASRIADVEATDASRFLARLGQPHRLLLHLAEGVDQAARDHFLALQYAPGQWAINENLVGIHCTALTAADFTHMAERGAAMVWSPLSNLLLYGATADVAAAKAAGVPIGLGSDWSVSGSKGLLGELKAAQLASTAAGGVFPDDELAAMATCDAARILGWEHALGSLAAGMRADIVGVHGITGDPYTTLVDAVDSDIALVVINGTARAGETSLMRALTSSPPAVVLETSAPGLASDHAVNLYQSDADPAVGNLTLTRADQLVRGALAALANGAGPQSDHASMPPRSDGAPVWHLALDEIQLTGAELRPRLPLLPHARAVADELRPSTWAGGPLVEPLRSDLTDDLTAIVLDALTATADTAFLATLETEPNLPADYGRQLAGLLA